MTTARTEPRIRSSAEGGAHPVTSQRPNAAIIIAGLLGGAATASGIALTATSGWLIVRASERPVILTLLTAIVAVRTFGIARPFFRYIERVRSHDAALEDLATRRTSIYSALIPLTPARLGRRSRSEVLAGVVDDLTDTVESQVRVTVPLVSSIVAGLLAVALAALMWPPVGLALAGLLVVLALGCWLAWRLELRSQSELLAARGEVQRVSDLVARRTDDLRAIGAEGTALSWLDAAHDTWRRATRTQSHGRALVAALILAGTGATAVGCAVLAESAGVSGPVKALLVVVPVAVGDALAPLAEAMRALARAQGSASRLDTLLAQTPAVLDQTRATPNVTAASPTAAAGASPTAAAGASPTAAAAAHPVAAHPVTPFSPEAGTVHSEREPFPPPVHGSHLERKRGDEATAVPHLRLDGVSASWSERTTGTGTDRLDLRPTTLDLPPGSRIAIVGSNGSGKSTLLAVLARHLDPRSGAYAVDGTDVRALPLDEVRDLFAVVDDEPHVFASTLRANLLVAAPDAEDASAIDALRRAGLGTWFDGLADGLDTRLGTGGRGISGGERARLSLARALLSERPVILLDEPVAHLDHASAVAIVADLVAATASQEHGGRAARTVVMVSHRPEGLEGFDRVIDLTPTEAPSTTARPSTPPEHRE